MPTADVRVFKTSNNEVPLLNWLRGLKRGERRAYKKCLARIIDLSKMGSEMHHTRELAAYLEDGIYELRARVGRVNYRILYFFYGKEVVALSHGFTKEDVIPPNDIKIARERMELVLKSPNKYTADFSLE